MEAILYLGSGWRQYYTLVQGGGNIILGCVEEGILYAGVQGGGNIICWGAGTWQYHMLGCREEAISYD